MILSKRAQDKHRGGQGRVYSLEQTQELMRCFKDPKYFIEHHLALQLPYGMTTFKLRPEQTDYIDAIHDHDSTICKHPRHAGISTATIAYLVWQSQFSCDETIAIVLPSTQHAQYAKILFRMMYANIPEYLRADTRFEGREDLEFVNGTRVIFRGASGNVARGKTLSTLYVGDLAYFDPLISHLMWAGLLPCLRIESKLIIHSTPTDQFNLFYDVWSEAVSGIVPIHAHDISFWDLHDASQAKWDALEATLGPKLMKRSYGCEFIT